MNRAAAALCMLWGAALPAFGQELRFSPDLAPDVAALPRLAGDGEIALAINARLDQIDAGDFDALNCYGGSRSDGPFRSVEVLSDGPDFLSLFIETSTYCEGAAHPWMVQEIVNFDLDSGDQTDLRDMIPDTFQSSDDAVDVLSVFFLNAVEDLSGSCARAFSYALGRGYLSFDLGVLESRGTLMLWPEGLAYVDTHCLKAAFVHVGKLR